MALPEIFGIMDISSTGETAKENRITILEYIFTAQLVTYFNQEKMTTVDEQRIYDLLGTLWEKATDILKNDQ